MISINRKKTGKTGRQYDYYKRTNQTFIYLHNYRSCTRSTGMVKLNLNHKQEIVFYKDKAMLHVISKSISDDIIFENFTTGITHLTTPFKLTKSKMS